MRLPPLSWFRRARSQPPPPGVAALLQEPREPVLVTAPPPRPAAPAPELWSTAHAALLDDLFGDGFVTPGGEEDVLKLGRPIGMTEGMTLLLVGAGTGGPVLSLARECGVWVTGYESVPAFLAIADRRIQRAKLGPRASIEPWFPSAPAFRPRFFHHALALLPLDGNPPEGVLAAIVKSLRPGGHLVMLEIVADPPLHAEETTMKSWLTLDRRLPTMPSETAVSRTLTKLGFDVRVAEDVTQQHLRAAMKDWQNLLRTIKDRPDPAVAALMVAEAERWMLRFELMRAHRLSLVRWHAILQEQGT